MLWALLISIILKTQIRKVDFNQKTAPRTEHTPGFYQIDAFRLQQYATAMDKKLESAILRHNQANKTMALYARMGKTTAAQNRAFARLLACDNRVLRTRKLAMRTNQDLRSAIGTQKSTTQITDIAYDLAYSSRLDLLKYQLSKLRTK